MLSDYIQISTPAEFNQIRNDPYGKYLLTADIDMTSLNPWQNHNFYGTLIGNGFRILNMTSDRANGGGGLFSVLNGCLINGLALENINVTGNGTNYTGGLANQSASSLGPVHLFNISIQGAVDTGGDRTGGIIGYLNGYVRVNSVRCDITFSGTQGTRCGYLAGWVVNPNGAFMRNVAFKRTGTVTALSGSGSTYSVSHLSFLNSIVNEGEQSPTVAKIEDYIRTYNPQSVVGFSGG